MRGVVQANEAGIGFCLLAGIAGKQPFGKAVVRAGNLGVDAGTARGESRDYGADGDRLDRKASSHVTFSHDGSNTGRLQTRYLVAR